MCKGIYLFSIIIPIYKTEKYLPECIDSILSQTFKNYEIILVDDGSPDKCPQICDYYVSKYSNVVCIHKENGGLSDARNAGILKAKGDWIFLLDSDDKLYNEDTLAGISETIEKKEATVIFCPGMVYFKGNICKYRNNFPKNVNICSPILLYKLCVKSKTRLCGPRFIVKRDFIVKNNLYFKQGILHEDIEWIPRILSLVNKVSIYYMPYYYYRQNNDSIMHNLSEKNAFDLMGIVKSYVDSNKRNGSFYNKGNKNFISYWSAMVLFSLISCVLPNIQYKNLSNVFKYKIMILSNLLLCGYGYKNILLYIYLKIFKLDITVYTIKLLRRKGKIW